MFNLYFWAMALLAVAWPAWMRWLSHLNLKHMRSGCPESLKGLYTPEEQEKALAFQAHGNKFGLVSTAVDVGVKLAFLFFGVYGLLEALTARVPGGLMARAAVFFAALYLWDELLGLPFGYYHSFVFLQRHGFNRSTKKLFVIDELKSLPLGLLMAVAEPVGSAFLLLAMERLFGLGKYFWIALWFFGCLVDLLMGYLWPVLIAPIFNKYTPLPEGELRDRALALARKTQVPFKNIYVVDSSKRHSLDNAYFTGLGRRRRCVLFDGLLEKYTDDEILAILSHEIGHYRQKRLRLLRYAMDWALKALQYFLLSLFIQSDGIAQALGGPEASFCLGFAALGLLWRPLEVWLAPLRVSLGRKMEMDADRYSVVCGYGSAQVSALKKLFVKNLGNYNRHPLMGKWCVPHPSLEERVAYLEGMM
ncbi:MAG: M48 family metallopeptidase [Firmicutes bacterium]|nr:M48 family metallopeptidase [Bacillota bacterium]